MNPKLAADVAAASAAYLFDILPSILALPPPEAYERIKAVFAAASQAYEDGKDGWFEPSRN